MNYLKVWTSFREIVEPLGDAERGRLFTAMLEYAEGGTAPEFSGNERFVWPVAKQSIDRAREENEKQAANGSRGGRPRRGNDKPTETQQNPPMPTETQQNPEKPTETHGNPAKPTESHKEKENDNEKGMKETTLTGGKEKPLARFSPPTVEEVAAYCEERKNKVNARQFVNFYTAKGWRVGNQPMKDWRAAVRTWEGRDESPMDRTKKRVSAQQYGQRDYSHGELDAAGVDLIAEARAMYGGG